ncbi:hypothetical protein MKJ04_12280 [Pontibacter sp. E15-1]|uniref:hypothetical protein n=1 Tax=Pontibacter sp. E15-1 TaxID=2919918 RepID=UPI001F4F2B86|nr:hypothetical protein [Pontibacter sp. E15-1]MCJ8165620.1 hypothetical protein [Pontibacter sp. E15-1]
MKKLPLLLLFLGIVFFYTEANAQTSQSSTVSTTDEYWGTGKVETKAAAADAVGNRSVGLDTRFNTYEDDRRKSFDKKRIANSKRMQEILNKEEKMMKKHKRDKRRLRRQRRAQ